MKKLYLFIFLIFEMLISCTKDEGDQADQIVYMEVNPDIILKSFRAKESDPNGFCQPFLIPSDSNVTYQLDLDEDTKTDYKITIRHSITSPWPPCKSHCYYYFISEIKITPLSKLAFISVIDKRQRYPKNYFEGEMISKKDLWNPEETIASYYDCAGKQVGSYSSSEPYWGLYFKGKLAWIKIQKGLDTELRILEWAYNQTAGNMIGAGQKN